MTESLSPTDPTGSNVDAVTLVPVPDSAPAAAMPPITPPVMSPVTSPTTSPITPEPAEDAPRERPSLTVLDHFGELRKRLFRICISIIVGFAMCWSFSDLLADWLYRPLILVLPSDGVNASSIIFTGLAEGFFTHMKLAILAGIFVVSPYIFYQIWAFIAPGLYAEEKKFVAPVAFCSALCFIIGGCFCYFVVFPNAFAFFMTYSEGPFNAMPGMAEYFDFTMQLILAFGLIFELPIFTFFLARLGVVTATAMRGFRRYFIVIAFIVGAVLTPPDVISQLLMAAPLLILYELSIIIAAVFGKAKKPKSNGPSTGDTSNEAEPTPNLADKDTAHEKPHA